MLYLYDLLVILLLKADKYQLSSISFRFTTEINDKIVLFEECSDLAVYLTIFCKF
jgi:hypothetical protein